MWNQPSIETGVGEVEAHARRIGHTWFDLTIALSAIAISVISLFVAMANGRTEQRMVAASSWPFLTFETEKNGVDSGGWAIYLRLRNGGVGPARVEWLRVTLDGTAIRSRVDLMKTCCDVPDGTINEEVGYGLVSQNEPVGIIPARDLIEILTWRGRPGNEAALAKLDAARHRLKTEACYCSVLDEYWISDLTATADPRKVEM